MRPLFEGALIEVIGVSVTLIGGVIALLFVLRAQARRDRQAQTQDIERRAWALKAVVDGVRQDADQLALRLDSLCPHTDPTAWLSAAQQAEATLDSHAQTLGQMDLSGIDSANVWPLLARLRADVRTAPILLRAEASRTALETEGGAALGAIRSVAETARSLQIQIKAAYGLRY